MRQARWRRKEELYVMVRNLKCRAMGANLVAAKTGWLVLLRKLGDSEDWSELQDRTGMLDQGLVTGVKLKNDAGLERMKGQEQEVVG